MRAQRRREVLVGVLLVGALLLLGWMSVQVGAFRGWAGGTEVVLVLPDAAGIQAGSEVRSAGVRVGSVDTLVLADGRARATLRLPSTAELPANVQPRVRSRSLLGEKYVDLRQPEVPEARRLADGDLLEMHAPSVDLDDLIGAVSSLAKGLDPEAVGEALAAWLDALQDDPDRPARWFAQVDGLLAGASEGADSLPAVVERLDQVVGDGARVLARLDARLVELRSPLARADQVLARADGVVQTWGEVGAAVDEDGRAALTALRGVLDGVDEEMVDDLRAVLSNLSAIDRWELRRLLREEGILLRVRARDVEEEPEP